MTAPASAAAPAPVAITRPRPERRATNLAGWLVRADSDRAFDFLLTDLSYGGCRLTTDAPLRRGEAVRLSVRGRGAIEATVRWRSGTAIGLSFAVEEDRTERPRQAERIGGDLAVLVRRAGRRSQRIEASDLSPHGCCLLFVDPPRTDDLVWVQLPGLAAIESRVRWVDDHRAGIGFVNPIHPAVFDLLLDRWRPAA